MENQESDWDDLPDWVRDFLDKNELTDLVGHYLRKPVPYDTFKDWTFDELRAIKFRTNILNRSKVSPSHSTKAAPLPFLYPPYEGDEITLCDYENEESGKQRENLTDIEPDEVEEGEREYLIREITRVYTVQVDAPELAPDCPHLIRIPEYFGPPLESLRRLKTAQLSALYGQLRKATSPLDEEES
jgi:hypothetical protein